MDTRRVALSGCSGGGKSTLLTELARRGFVIVEEPGRRIIATGGPMPWDDPVGFARRAVDMALADLEAAGSLPGPVFFDRGLVDAAVALEHASGAPIPLDLTGRYDRAFLAPPWPEIHGTDAVRRHGMAEACAEYARLEAAWPMLGYRVHLLPKASVEARADFVLERLETRDGIGIQAH